MKSGTTSLFNYLSQHPEIAGSRRKEPNFFSYDDRWNQGFEWYLQEWPNWNPQQHKIALEATINYTKFPIYPNAAERIYQLKDKANFKFIYIMRNPIERIESHYTYELSSNRRNNIKKLYEDWNIEQELIEASKYAKQLKEYYNRFHEDSILLINFSDFKKDSFKILKKVCNFLNVLDNFQFQNTNIVHNPTQGRIIDDQVWQLFRKNKFLRQLVNQTITEEQKQILHSFFGKKIKQNFQLLPEQKKRVLLQLKEDIYDLETKYNFDTSQWNIK